MRISPSPINSRYAVRRTPTARTRTSWGDTPVHVLHRSPEEYDAVKREPLRVVLARFGVRGEMLTIFRQFHEGMRPRVRTGDAEQSEWFDVTQVFHQGCVLSPVLFNVNFACSMHAVLVRFSKDPDIVRDLVRLEEDLGGLECTLNS